MAKVRVHELAMELGVPSREVLALLQDMGEFVKSASSTVEAAVVRRLHAQHGDRLRAAGERRPKGREQARERQAVRATRPAPEPVRPQMRIAPDGFDPFMAEVARKKREGQRGKRYRGTIDAATQDSLARMGAHDPPYLDEHAAAKAETDEWLTLGVIPPEEIVRWRHTCPGIWPTVGMAFVKCRVPPNLAALGVNKYNEANRGERALYLRVQDSEMLADDARWLLEHAGLLAA